MVSALANYRTVADLAPLTDQQRRVLEMVCDWARTRGYQPSYRDVGAALHIRTCNGVQCHFSALVTKGYVKAGGGLRNNGNGGNARAVRILVMADGRPFRGFVDGPATGHVTIPDDQKVTDRALGVLRAIYEGARDNGYQPTVKELIAAYGLKSPNSIHGHLRVLEKRGWIVLHRHARAVEFLRRPDGRPFRGFLDKGSTQ
jgi:SOS-response transcriptional repressor LexA